MRWWLSKLKIENGKLKVESLHRLWAVPLPLGKGGLVREKGVGGPPPFRQGRHENGKLKVRRKEMREGNMGAARATENIYGAERR
jgi:hypothetical protein